MLNFSYYLPTHFVFGRGAEEKAGEMTRQAGGTRVLIHYGGGSALPLHAPTHQFCAVPARSLFVNKYFQKYSKKLFILGKKCGKVKTCQMWSIPHHNKYICRVGRAYPGAKRGL